MDNFTLHKRGSVCRIIAVWWADTPPEKVCHCEETPQGRCGNLPQVSGNLEVIATPVCGLVRNDMGFMVAVPNDKPKCKKEETTMNNKVNYDLLCAQMEALAEGVPYEMANLANASALLWQTLEGINWAGFYKMMDGKLVLGPFQGKTACTQISVGRGVCGTAVAEDRTQLVADVHQFPGHIACDGASNSEIVVPIRVRGEIWGVLDIDSPHFERFSSEDQQGLERFVQVLEGIL